MSAHQCSSFRWFRTYTGRYTCHCWDHVLCHEQCLWGWLIQACRSHILCHPFFAESHACLFWICIVSHMPDASNAGISCKEKGSCWSGLHDWCFWTVSECNSIVSFFVGRYDYTHTNIYIHLCMELKFQLLVNLFQFSLGDNVMEYDTGEYQCNLTKCCCIHNILLDRCWSLRFWNQSSGPQVLWVSYLFFFFFHLCLLCSVTIFLFPKLIFVDKLSKFSKMRHKYTFFKTK